MEKSEGASGKEFTSKNKVKVIYKKIPDFHSVAVGVFVKVGSRTEDEEISGISHFVEHILFKGTKKRTSNQIKEEIEGVGGMFNAFTSEEATCYWIKILDEYLEKTFDVLSDMIENPALKKEDIEKERAVILEEIKMYKDIPAKYVHEIFDSMLFEGHHLGRPIAGTEETVKKITKEDMEKYMNELYGSSNIVISVAGNFSENKIRDLSKKYFKLRNGRKITFPKWQGNESGPKVKVLKKDTEQTHIVIGGLGYSREDNRKYPLCVLNTILGGNMSSRLFNKIREEMGLAYEIGSFIRNYTDTGAFIISAGVKHSNSLKATEAIIGELVKIRNEGVNDDEIERSKKYLISHTLMGLEGNLEYMMFLGEQRLLREKITSVEEIRKKIEEVTKEDVKEVAEQLFTQKNFYLAMISPYGEGKKFLKITDELK